MSDLISRQALIKILDNRQQLHSKNWSDFKNYMGDRKTIHATEYKECRKILDIVENQSSIEIIPPWIPCGERLPNTNGVYQVTRKVLEGNDAFFIASCAYFDGQDTWHNDNRVNHSRHYLNDVIAWLPLSEPYKGE